MEKPGAFTGGDELSKVGIKTGYQAVLIPGAIWLLGFGLISLAAARKKCKC